MKKKMDWSDKESMIQKDIINTKGTWSQLMKETEKMQSVVTYALTYHKSYHILQVHRFLTLLM